MTERIENIKDKNDFIQFVKDLAQDYGDHYEEWANTTIPDFLQQMAGWVEDYSVCPANVFAWEKVDFRVLASILSMGNLYE